MPEVNRRGLLIGAAAFTAAGLLPGTAAAATRRGPATARPALTAGDRAVLDRLDVRRALEHLRVLSDDIGWRVAGTPADRRAARYIAGELRDFGYQVELRSYPVEDRNLAEVRAKGEPLWQCGASLQGTVESMAGTVVDVGPVTEIDTDVRGVPVLFDRLRGKETEQVRAAADAGASAVVFVNTRWPDEPEIKAGTFPPELKESFDFPVLGLAEYHGERIRAGARHLSFEVSRLVGASSYNVVAERKGTDPNGRAVIVSGHYDSVPGSPGGNDDGSGTVLSMEVARALQPLRTPQTVRVCLWGAEELGDIGSQQYVKQLDDAAAARISGCFQNDMSATSHPDAGTYWLLSVDGADNTTTAAVGAAARRLGYGGHIKGPVARGSSDHESFHERGIAAGNFSWRGPEAPSQLEPVYHTPEDTIAGNISPERLKMSLEMIGCAAYDVASRP